MVGLCEQEVKKLKKTRKRLLALLLSLIMLLSCASTAFAADIDTQSADAVNAQEVTTEEEKDSSAVDLFIFPYTFHKAFNWLNGSNYIIYSHYSHHLGVWSKGGGKLLWRHKASLGPKLHYVPTKLLQIWKPGGHSFMLDP